MTRYLLLLGVPLTVAALLTGAGGRDSEPAPEPVPPAESAEAARYLDEAIARFSPVRVAWAEMTLWQRVWQSGVSHEVQGRYTAAPGDRLRLEWKVQVGATLGELKLVSDGKVLWQSQRYGAGPATTTQTELSRKPPSSMAPPELLRANCFLGVSPLIQMLRERMQNLRCKALRWKGFEVVQVTGDWPEDPTKLADVPEPLRPRYLPRRCCLYLDAKTTWPHRIEWWGAHRARGHPVLLLEMEFRDPILNRPLSPEQCVREFTLTPS